MIMMMMMMMDLAVAKTFLTVYPLIEGSLEVKLTTIWTDRKEEVGRVRGGKEVRRSEQRRERERRKKMQVHEKVGKSRFTVFS